MKAGMRMRLLALSRCADVCVLVAPSCAVRMGGSSLEPDSLPSAQESLCLYQRL